MKICRFADDARACLGILDGDALYDLTAVDPTIFADLAHAHSHAISIGDSLSSLLQESRAKARIIPYEEARLLIPVIPREIWGAGVTYLQSREAREDETRTKGLYDYVYSAERPELFVKDSGIRVRGPGEEIFVRSDSAWSVPEPELSVVLDSECRIFGYTVGNDVSSRDIEGENPLYLPQAKVYLGSSSIGPVITTADEIPDPHKLRISMRILRNGGVVFSGEVNTSQMKRRVDELVRFLKRDNILETFTVLMTGTSIVPPNDFTLDDGDAVEIEIDKIGLLRNPVRKLRR